MPTRTTVNVSPPAAREVIREVRTEDDGTAGWVVAALIVMAVLVIGFLVWANSNSANQAAVQSAALSARTDGMIAGAQATMGAAGGAAADAAANASQAAVNAMTAKDAAESARQTTSQIANTPAPASVTPSDSLAGQ